MSVLTMYVSTLDEKKTFDNKKDADSYDKQLQLGKSLGDFIAAKFPTLPAEVAGDIGVVLAGHKDDLLLALKGKPEVLLPSESTESFDASVANDNTEVPADSVSEVANSESAVQSETTSEETVNTDENETDSNEDDNLAADSDLQSSESIIADVA